MRNRKDRLIARSDDSGRTTRSSGATLRPLAIASGFGCSVVAILAVLIGGGIVIDRHFGTAPIWTLIGIVLGIIAVGGEYWTLIRASREGIGTRGKAATIDGPRRSPPPGWADEDDDETVAMTTDRHIRDERSHQE